MGSEQSNPTRRDFVKTAGSAMAAAALVGVGRSAVHADTEIKVGLIGCGGRGTGAARQALAADPNAKLVAMGDAFQDRLDSSLENLNKSDMAQKVAVDPEHRFVGFDAFQKVIDSCDVLVMASPPHFRPKHLRAAIEAGKHVFCEKPVAVDGPGVRSVMESCKLAKEKNLNVVSGLCYRYQFAKQDIIQRIHDGAVGDILSMQTTYNTGSLWHHGKKDDWSEMEYQVRNWLYFNWLSGDHINEQHIHSLDKIAWAMNEYPVSAVASGGRTVRTEEKYGNIYDHFNTTYQFANGVKCFSSCRQWQSAVTDVSDHVIGTKGIAHIQSHNIDFHDGSAWAHEPSGPDDMYQNEHNALFKAIRDGETINNGDYMCNSTLMAIMGRMSAYTGQAITREQALNSEERLGPDSYEWGSVTAAPIAVPGVTTFS